VSRKFGNYDHFIGRGRTGIENTHNRDWIVLAINADSTFSGENIGAQLAACGYNLHVTDPQQAAGNESEHYSGYSGEFWTVSKDKLSRASASDNALDEAGNVFYVLLAGGICLMVGLALLK
jgi:hypothetical protein